MSVRIGVVGSVNLDLVASGAPLPKAGETVTGSRFAQHPGGKGANQALAARRMGADVHMVGRVGDDALAETALSLLRKDGVEVSGVMAELGQSTGVALIAVSPEGENQITVASGANALVDDMDVLGLPKCDAILCQLEVPVAAVMAASRLTTGIFAINLAPAIEVPHALLQKADLLIVNELEAAFYGDALHAGQGYVALTLGGEGASLFKAGQEVARTAAFEVPVLDTTGAGDTFCAALVVALAEGQTPEVALRLASAAAALAVTKPGAQPSLPRRAEVEALLKAV